MAYLPDFSARAYDPLREVAQFTVPSAPEKVNNPLASNRTPACTLDKIDSAVRLANRMYRSLQSFVPVAGYSFAPDPAVVRLTNANVLKGLGATLSTWNTAFGAATNASSTSTLTPMLPIRSLSLVINALSNVVLSVTARLTATMAILTSTGETAAYKVAPPSFTAGLQIVRTVLAGLHAASVVLPTLPAFIQSLVERGVPTFATSSTETNDYFYYILARKYTEVDSDVSMTTIGWYRTTAAATIVCPPVSATGTQSNFFGPPFASNPSEPILAAWNLPLVQDIEVPRGYSLQAYGNDMNGALPVNFLEYQNSRSHPGPSGVSLAITSNTATMCEGTDCITAEVCPSAESVTTNLTVVDWLHDSTTGVDTVLGLSPVIIITPVAIDTHYCMASTTYDNSSTAVATWTDSTVYGSSTYAVSGSVTLDARANVANLRATVGENPDPPPPPYPDPPPVPPQERAATAALPATSHLPVVPGFTPAQIRAVMTAVASPAAT